MKSIYRQFVPFQGLITDNTQCCQLASKGCVLENPLIPLLTTWNPSHSGPLCVPLSMGTMKFSENVKKHTQHIRKQVLNLLKHAKNI